jgi:hypothetical protein
MLIVSVVLNVVLLAVVCYLLYPDIQARLKPTILPVRVESHYVVSHPTPPTCPTCGKELIGKIKKSVTGHWCCQECFVTKFNSH